MKITILISTYNGEKYLREQLDSLVNQDLKPNKILIRDDGSSDNTINILNEYSKKYSYIEYYQGENKKPAKSFFELINKTDKADYYALCDQDDVWFSNKLSCAVNILEKEDKRKPLLYCGRMILTDENLVPLNSNISSLYSYTDFPHSLLYQTAPGCTFVFNEKAKEHIIKYDIENNYCMIHDSIIHKIVAMFGKVILDEDPHMYYRQHQGNAIGLSANKLLVFVNRVKHFADKTSANTRSNMAKALLDTFKEEIDENSANLLRTVAYYKENKQYKKQLLQLDCFKVSGINYFFYKILVILNKI